jgi:hypothetical protein
MSCQVVDFAASSVRLMPSSICRLEVGREFSGTARYQGVFVPSIMASELMAASALDFSWSHAWSQQRSTSPGLGEIGQHGGVALSASVYLSTHAGTA